MEPIINLVEVASLEAYHQRLTNRKGKEDRDYTTKLPDFFVKCIVELCHARRKEI